MKPSDTAKLVMTLVQAFPNAPVTTETSKLYERMLADLDRDAAAAAVERLIATSKWFPTIAEIRQAAADIRHGPSRVGGEAWGDVVAAMRSVGHYGCPHFDDEVVTECVRLLGWHNLCLSTNETADRARFIETYDRLAQRRRVDLVAGKALPAPSAARLPASRPALTDGGRR